MTKSRGIITRVPWSAGDDQVIRDRYPHEPAARIAAELGRAIHTVYSRAQRLGVEKSETFLASEASGRITRDRVLPGSIATRFARGKAPPTAGTKGVSGQHEHSRRTQFKPGRAAPEAHNYVPIGTEKINVDGYLVRKVTDDPTLAPVRRWEFVHRLVWIAANGTIPPGHMVVFRPGRRTTEVRDITLDALELVSRQEHMRRHSYHTNYPTEVAQLIQLKGALTRKIKRRSQV